MKSVRLWLGFSFATAASLVFSCGNLIKTDPVAFGGVGGQLISLPTGQGVGDDCSTQACRLGLECVDNVCQPGMSLPEGSFCLIGPECEAGLACVALTCVKAGDAQIGEACEGDADCSSGLKCVLNGFEQECAQAGTTDLGGACTQQADCFQGLFCTDGECSVEPPLWDGVKCPKPSKSGAEALFAVPGASGTADSADFFSLPYPNDLRIDGSGHPDLKGFPTPGPELLGVDMVARYVEAIETHATGFSSTTSVLFRFSGKVSTESLTFDGTKRPVILVDLDDPASTPSTMGVSWAYNSGRGNYVCENSLSVNAGLGRVLTPGHSYAVWVTTDARDEDGNPVSRSSQFASLLGNAAPSDAALLGAHNKYQKLRSYLSAKSIDPGTILVASVFTIEDPIEPMRNLAAQVAAADIPAVTDWVKCEAGADSPCPQAEGGRACGAQAADYDEYHALISLPIFQEGVPPYLDEGGAISDEVVRTEEVCMSLTIPKGTQPVSGWPLVIYAHGTGGSFRSHVIDEISGELARAATPFAVVGIDQVQHGPRRGDSDADPDTLFFNFTNPDAARGNPMQGAADQLSLRRALSALSVTGAQTGGNDILIDPSRVLFYGHSQGSTHGSLMLPLSGFPGAVLSGNGGSLKNALLTKRSPKDIAAAVPYALQDATSSGVLFLSTDHPALGLLQHYIDPADPVNFAPLLVDRVEASGTPKHVLQTFGLDDTFSPPSTMAAFVYAAGPQMALAPKAGSFTPSGSNKLSIDESMTPVSGNATVAAETYTLVTRQYQAPSGQDGHHIAFDVQPVIDDIVGFLSALSSGSDPTVPAP